MRIILPKDPIVSLARIVVARALVVIVLLVAPGRYARAGLNEWTSTGPEGGPISAIAFDPQSPMTIYVGTLGGGVFKTMNGGFDWTAVNVGLTASFIHVLAIDRNTPSTLYAGASNGGRGPLAAGNGVFKSTDGGATWNAANAGLPGTAVRAIAIDPEMTDILYAGAGGVGVFKSIDGGAMWHEVDAGLTARNIVSLVIDPAVRTTLYAGDLLAGVFKTTNSGASWNTVNAGLAVTQLRALAIAKDAAHTLYAGTLTAGVFTSSDGGTMWSPANTGLTSSFIQALVVGKNVASTIYAGTSGGGIFRSIDSGVHWNQLQPVTAGTPFSNVAALAVHPTDASIVFAGSAYSGLFRTFNGGTDWSTIDSGLHATDVRTVAVDPLSASTIYAGTQFGGLFRSIDRGRTWSVLPNSGLSEFFTLRSLAFDTITPTPSIAYLLTGNAGVFKSTDGAASWVNVNRNLNGSALALDPKMSNILYVGTSKNVDGGVGGVFKSVNSGMTWNPANVGIQSANVRALAVDWSTPTTLYIGTGAIFGLSTTGAGIFKSVDGGSSWTPKNTGLTNLDVEALAIDPVTPSIVYAGTLGILTGGVFKSADGGDNWVAVNSGLPAFTGVHALAVNRAAPNALYAGTDDGIFKTTTRGATWAAVNTTGLNPMNVNALAVDPKQPAVLYAATQGGGVFQIEQAGGVNPSPGTFVGMTDEGVLTIEVGSIEAIAFPCGGSAIAHAFSPAAAVNADGTFDVSFSERGHDFRLSGQFSDDNDVAGDIDDDANQCTSAFQASRQASTPTATPSTIPTPTIVSTPVEPQGFVPPDKTTAKCEDAVAKNIGKLASCVRKCHIKQADMAAKAKPFDEEGCENGSGKPISCRRKYDAASQTLVAKAICPGCLDATAQSNLADSLTSTLENEQGDVYCAGSSALGDDDHGRVPPDDDTRRCEDAVAKGVSAFGGCVQNCEKKQADVEFKGKAFDKIACENVGRFACRAKYDGASAKLEPKLGKQAICPPCLDVTARGSIADNAESFLEQIQAHVYCSGTVLLQ